MVKGNYPVDTFEGLNTPFYFYDIPLLEKTLEQVMQISQGNPSYVIHYAVKANFNQFILKKIASFGLGADCVSGGEIRVALEAGFEPEGIVFAGVGKSDWEIKYALNCNIGRFNVESYSELEVLNQIAEKLGKIARVSFRVNPNLKAHTHSKITTGLAENKFGINCSQLESVLERASEMKNIKYIGIHFHIGSQIVDMSDFATLSRHINDIVDKLDKCGFHPEDINVGGGLGIDYEHPNHHDIADFNSYFATFRDNLRFDGTVHFELGRSIVAPCGSLISKVLYIKEGAMRRFAILDASMAELIRPALYGAYHRVENISSDEEPELYDVVGPVCESSDVFLEATIINKCHRGDYIAIRSAGAYGESMSSHYNCRSAGDPFYFEG